MSTSVRPIFEAIYLHNGARIDAWSLWSTHRKSNPGSRTVTWPMTSRDPKRSKSWPHYVWGAMSQAEQAMCNGDFSFLWESQKFDPSQNQNHWSDWNKRWQGWLSLIGDPSCKISCKSAQGGFSASRWNIRKNFYSYPYRLPFLLQLTYRSDPSADFCVRWRKRRGLAQGCAFWELKNLKLIFNVFIQKNSKKLQWSLWEKLNNS